MMSFVWSYYLVLQKCTLTHWQRVAFSIFPEPDTVTVTAWDFWQEEEALLSEMDVTGQAFEDMQEQNSRLLQQLREKDDANFKLMSERIKSNQIYKLLKEEKEELADQVLTFKTQVVHHLQAAAHSAHCVEILSM